MPLLKKLRPPSTALWMEKGKYNNRNEDCNYRINTSRWLYTLFLFLFFAISFLMLCFRIYWQPHPCGTTKTTIEPEQSMCRLNASVYVYDLPAKFNFDLLKDCRHLNIYTNMCPHVANRGLGQPLRHISSPSSWFATHQFIGEMIFHARMENHPCRTTDPQEANLFYIPFYGGLHASSKFREPDLALRDRLAVELVDHVKGQPLWRRNGGKDHFMVLGRTAWDFMRDSNAGPDFGANRLLDMPNVKNMSVLTVERQPWKGLNQYGIPYPTYFHPVTSLELFAWQRKMAQSLRPHLFTFIGGPRKGVRIAAIRDDLIRQCNESSHCNLVKCGGANGGNCHNPMAILNVMASSRFCLQAPGDSFTRRSVFDAVLAGCIPVFFSPHMAYTQYMWFLPSNRREYSVYMEVEGNVTKKRIEEEMLQIPDKTVEKMRNRVIELIPRIIYAHPNATDIKFHDAVDVALESLFRKLYIKVGE